jgi:hypothetical protein
MSVDALLARLTLTMRVDFVKPARGGEWVPLLWSHGVGVHEAV